MSTSILSTHAHIRLAQRAICADDLALAVLIGTEVEGGYFVREKDSAAVAASLHRLADRIRRMAGLRIVSDGNTIITAYRATRRKQKYLLRAAEDREIEG